ncbi:CBS domain-containing protein [Mycolicibacterium pyrenivorans]|uniref:CBS domain-containing protein n=1 Tax=Mycolicibacterium pyrenivorans TaxID=187102 RepID=UPI0021F2F8F5|nr:CBS domain-containing protein [Mycolicibacterium pyrenivorans]MCV7150071.1 CBS domain-containing protein [Mycolicibacterium pyrenivorans]
MNTARDIMNPDTTCVFENANLVEAAKRMRDLGVGALPICRDDDRIQGMLTDRDIVVKAIAADKDLRTTSAGELAQGRIYYVDADAGVDEMLLVMEEHQVRRLPVIDDHRLIGIVTEADIARHLPEHAIVDFVKAICAPRAITPGTERAAP